MSDRLVICIRLHSGSHFYQLWKTELNDSSNLFTFVEFCNSETNRKIALGIGELKNHILTDTPRDPRQTPQSNHGQPQQRRPINLEQSIIPSTFRHNLQQHKQQFLQQSARRTQKKHFVNTAPIALNQARCKLCISSSFCVWITFGSKREMWKLVYPTRAEGTKCLFQEYGL